MSNVVDIFSREIIKAPERKAVMVRVNFSSEAYDALRTVANVTNRTMSQTLSEALARLDYFTSVQREGGRILVQNGSSLREIVSL